MVRIEGDKLVIELDVRDPKRFYGYLIKDIPICIQAIAETGLDERNPALPDSLVNLLELYMALLPERKQVKRIFKKRK